MGTLLMNKCLFLLIVLKNILLMDSELVLEL